MALRCSLRLALVAGLGAALLAGCAAAPQPAPTQTVLAPAPSSSPAPTSPSPSPTPTGPPALADLAITPDGLGDLVVGAPIDTELADLDPAACLTPEREERGVAVGDPGVAAWVPRYAPLPGGRHPFQLLEAMDGTLHWVVVWSPEIATERGIRVGATEAEVRTAYPDAAIATGGVDGKALAFSLVSDIGRLVIEVQNRVDNASAEDRTVWAIRAEGLTPDWGPFANSGAPDFYCNLED